MIQVYEYTMILKMKLVPQWRLQPREKGQWGDLDEMYRRRFGVQTSGVKLRLRSTEVRSVDHGATRVSRVSRVRTWSSRVSCRLVTHQIGATHAFYSRCRSGTVLYVPVTWYSITGTRTWY